MRSLVETEALVGERVAPNKAREPASRDLEAGAGGPGGLGVLQYAVMKLLQDLTQLVTLHLAFELCIGDVPLPWGTLKDRRKAGVGWLFCVTHSHF